jgi:ribonuclease D
MPKIITNTADLKSNIKKWLACECLAIDTEFLRDKTFYPQLCLIQIADFENIWLIDPLAEGIDISAFAEVLIHKKTLKIFHSARQDLEICLQEWGVLPTPIADTQVAAMFCGLGEAISYGGLVHECLKKHLDKSHQFTDWTARPLSDEQLAYAARDVLHLIDVHKEMHKRLSAQNRTEWYEEELLRMYENDSFVITAQNIAERITPNNVNFQQQFCARKLVEWREEEAKKLNVPRGFLLKDAALLELAIRPPRTYKDFLNRRIILPGLTPYKKEEDCWKVLKQALDTKLENGRELIAQRFDIHAHLQNKAPLTLLKALRRHCATESLLAERLLANDKDLSDLLRNEENIPINHGWRWQVFGIFARDLLDGKIHLAMTKDDCGQYQATIIYR